MANKAYKFRIYPTDDQKVWFAKTFGCVRFVYNKMLSDKIEHHKLTGKMLKNTPAQYKTEFTWLKDVDSFALANAQLDLQKAYTNFFTNPKHFGFPKFKSKHGSRNSYTTNLSHGNISLGNGFLKLPKVGRVKVKQHRAVPSNYVLKSVTVSQVPSGKYYASVLFEYENQVQEQELHNFLGLDYSMHELCVDSNGREPAYPRYYRKAEKKLKCEQRKLSLMQKNSKNREKQRVKVAMLHEKIANQRKDFLHNQSKQLADTYDCICIEDLNMQAMSKRLHFGKSVHDNGWGLFTKFLAYKLSDRGKRLVKVGKFFASSQTCSCCGYNN